MPQIPELESLLEAGLHFGHHTSKWHPAMKEYIYGVKKSIHIIDLEKTQQKLAETLAFVQQLGRERKTLLFVGTKPHAQSIVKMYAIKAGLPYMVERWMGGTFTNFAEIKKVIRKFIDLSGRHERGELGKYTKKEQLLMEREIEKMRKDVGGLVTLEKLPDAVFIVDVKREGTALQEANRVKIPVIALADSNVNHRLLAYPIPGNDDAVRSIELVTKLIADAYLEGLAQAPVVVSAPEAVPASKKSSSQKDPQSSAKPASSDDQVDVVVPVSESSEV